VVEALLQAIHTQTPDRVVLVSSFTSTLDVLEQMCLRKRWTTLRLDGSVALTNRQGLVEQFNRGSENPTRKAQDPFVFLCE
jgi:DNA repair and recombination RAD54-like protein